MRIAALAARLVGAGAVLAVAAVISGNVFAQSYIRLSGTFVAGPAPVTNTAIAVYPISNGQIAPYPISVRVTDSSGAFAVQAPPNTPVLVVGNIAPSGVYTDPILGDRQLRGQIRAILVTGAADSRLTLSPVSEAATQVTLGETADQLPALITNALITAGNYNAAQFLLGVDPLTTVPRDATSAAAMSGATPGEKLFALTLAAVSLGQTRDNGYTLTQLQQYMAASIQAGAALPDAGGGFPDDSENEAALPASATMQYLVGSFAGDAKNKTGVSSLYNLGLAIQGGGPSGGTVGAWSQACVDAINSTLTARANLPQTPLSASRWQDEAAYGHNPWGPSPTVYPVIAVPTGCDPVTYQRTLLMAAANQTIQQQYNYCHHYTPAWNSAGLIFPHSNGAVSPGPSACYPTKRDQLHLSLAANQTTQMGVDCSNYTSWLYNYAIGGMRMTGDITAQAGSLPGAHGAAAYSNAWAPGKVYALPTNWQNYYTPGTPEYQQYPFQPGDLLYVNAGSQTEAQRGIITHVVMWTGVTVPNPSGNGVVYLVTESFGAAGGVKDGQPVDRPQAPIPNQFPFANAATSGPYTTAYLLNAGPNMRYFDTTFRASNLVHYRRVIGESTTP